jgi:biotin operon repressor
MRAERLLRLLLCLQTRGRSTVAQLAQHLEVSPRTVQRDLDALSLAGVPVYSIRGRGGGWALLPDYRTRLTGLTPSEVMSVFVGATAHVLADLGVDASSDQAMAKLIAALPEPARKDAEFARQRLLIDHGVGRPARDAAVAGRLPAGDLGGTAARDHLPEPGGALCSGAARVGGEEQDLVLGGGPGGRLCPDVPVESDQFGGGDQSRVPSAERVRAAGVLGGGASAVPRESAVVPDRAAGAGECCAAFRRDVSGGGWVVRGRDRPGERRRSLRGRARPSRRRGRHCSGGVGGRRPTGRS